MTTTGPEREALAPCPFCGTPGPSIIEQRHADGVILYAVKCYADQCWICIEGYTSKATAIAAWNTRAPSAQVAPDLIAACKERLASDEGMFQFILYADPRKIGEEEWKHQHEALSQRGQKAAIAMRSALASAAEGRDVVVPKEVRRIAEEILRATGGAAIGRSGAETLANFIVGLAARLAREETR